MVYLRYGDKDPVSKSKIFHSYTSIAKILSTPIRYVKQILTGISEDASDDSVRSKPRAKMYDLD